MYDWDDICYECTGYGDDYELDEDGELICRVAVRVRLIQTESGRKNERSIN